MEYPSIFCVLNFFIKVLYFAMYRSITSQVKFIHRHFIVFNIIVNRIIFFISVSDNSLLVCRIVTGFVCCFFIFLIFIVIQLQSHVFYPHSSTPPQVNPPPSPTSTLPLGFLHVSFIVVPVIPSSHCPRLPPTPPGYCQIVFNFNVSGYILFAFFFY